MGIEYPRMLRRFLRVLAGLGLILLIALALYQVVQPKSELRDFATFVEAGQAYKQGLNPYVRLQEPDPEAGIKPGTPDEGLAPNLNPPISIYPFSLLADVDPFAARNGLGVVSALIYGGACILLLRAYPEQRRPVVKLCLLAIAGFWYTVLLGQIYIPLFALGLGALLLIERGRNPLWAGVLAGLLVAIKPNFVLWPLLLLLTGHRKLGLTMIATAAAVSAVPLLIEGPGIYKQWMEAVRAYQHADLSINASMYGTAARLGIPEAGYVLAAGFIAAAGYYAWRWRLTPREASAWGIMLTLLVGPLTWVGYTLLMLPLLLSRRWARWEIAILMTMLVPSGLGWIAGEIRLAGIVMLSGLVLNDTLQARHNKAEAGVESPTVATAGQAA